MRDSSTPDRQPRPGIRLQILPSQIGRSLTCSNRAMDDGGLANDLPDWWPYPVWCGHGHPWSPGHVLVSYLRCPCRRRRHLRAHRGPLYDGWLPLSLVTPAALPARHGAIPRRCFRPTDLVRRPSAKWRAQYRGEPVGEPRQPTQCDPESHWSVRYPVITRRPATMADASRHSGSRSHRESRGGRSMSKPGLDAVAHCGELRCDR